MALTPAARHLGLQVSPLISPHLPSIPPPATLRAPVSLYTPQTSVPDVFRTSPWKSRLVATHRRIEFVILWTASSPPVALHPASQRRSYLQLQGLGLPWHGLSLCWCRAFTGALPRPAGSFLMPLRRTPHHPDKEVFWRAKGQPFPLRQGLTACCGEVKEGARRAEGHERRHAVGPCRSPTASPRYR